MKAEELLALAAVGAAAYAVAKSGESKGGGGGGIFPIPIEKPISLPGINIQFPALDLPKIEIPKFDFSWLGEWQKGIARQQGELFDFLEKLINKAQSLPKEIPNPVDEAKKEARKWYDEFLKSNEQLAKFVFSGKWAKDISKPWIEEIQKAINNIGISVFTELGYLKKGTEVVKPPRKKISYDPIKDLQNMMSKAKVIHEKASPTKRIIDYHSIPASVRAKHSAGAIYDYIKNTIGLGSKGTVTFYGSGFGSLSNKIVIS